MIVAHRGKRKTARRVSSLGVVSYPKMPSTHELLNLADLQPATIDMSWQTSPLDDFQWDIADPFEFNEVLYENGTTDRYQQDSWVSDVAIVVGKTADWVLANADKAIDLYQKVTGKQPPPPPPPIRRTTTTDNKMIYLLIGGGILLYLLLSKRLK